MILDILIAVLLFVGLLAAIGLAIVAWLTLPLSDLLNRVFRSVGLAGPSPDTRAVGGRAVGRVDEAFEVRPGEESGFGTVFVGGETWTARCPASLAATLEPGDAVQVEYDSSLVVIVKGRIVTRAGDPPPGEGGRA